MNFSCKSSYNLVQANARKKEDEKKGDVTLFPKKRYVPFFSSPFFLGGVFETLLGLHEAFARVGQVGAHGGARGFRILALDGAENVFVFAVYAFQVFGWAVLRQAGGVDAGARDDGLS